MTVRHPEKINNIDSPIQKKPAWIRVKASYSQDIVETKNILKKNNLITVCEEASCQILMNVGAKNMQPL